MKSNFYNSIHHIIEFYLENDRFYLTSDELNSACKNEELYSTLHNINAIVTYQNKIFLNFENELIFSIKKSTDIFNLYKLPIADINNILSIKEELINISKNRSYTIILVGSYARNKATENSDYDFIVVADEKIKYKKFSNDKKIEIICYDRPEFKKGITLEDEFILWALKYGLILHDNNFISQYYPTHDSYFSELKTRKKNQLERMVYRTSLSFGSNKINIISKRLNDLKKQIIRSSIIASDKIPKSSPEISQQARQYVFNPNICSMLSKPTAHNNQSYNELKEDFDSLRKYYFEWLRGQLSSIIVL